MINLKKKLLSLGIYQKWRSLHDHLISVLNLSLNN